MILSDRDALVLTCYLSTTIISVPSNNGCWSLKATLELLPISLKLESAMLPIFKVHMLSLE